MTDIAKPARRPRPPRFPKPFCSDTPLRARERRFVEEYLVDLKGEAAAIRAGYHPKNARSQASRLSTKANIQAALEAGYKERQARTRITADSTVRGIGCRAHSDIRKFHHATRQLPPN